MGRLWCLRSSPFKILLKQAFFDQFTDDSGISTTYKFVKIWKSAHVLSEYPSLLLYTLLQYWEFEYHIFQLSSTFNSSIPLQGFLVFEILVSTLYQNLPSGIVVLDLEITVIFDLWPPNSVQFIFCPKHSLQSIKNYSVEKSRANSLWTHCLRPRLSSAGRHRNICCRPVEMTVWILWLLVHVRCNGTWNGPFQGHGR